MSEALDCPSRRKGSGAHHRAARSAGWARSGDAAAAAPTVAALGGVRVAAAASSGLRRPRCRARAGVLLVAALVAPGRSAPIGCAARIARRSRTRRASSCCALLVATAQVFTLVTPRGTASSRSSSRRSFCCCSGTRWRSGPIAVSSCAACRRPRRRVRAEVRRARGLLRPARRPASPRRAHAARRRHRSAAWASCQTAPRRAISAS